MQDLCSPWGASCIINILIPPMQGQILRVWIIWPHSILASAHIIITHCYKMFIMMAFTVRWDYFISHSPKWTPLQYCFCLYEEEKLYLFRVILYTVPAKQLNRIRQFSVSNGPLRLSHSQNLFVYKQETSSVSHNNLNRTVSDASTDSLSTKSTLLFHLVNFSLPY
jgi:hypothetical protein